MHFGFGDSVAACLVNSEPEFDVQIEGDEVIFSEQSTWLQLAVEVLVQPEISPSCEGLFECPSDLSIKQLENLPVENLPIRCQCQRSFSMSTLKEV